MSNDHRLAEKNSVTTKDMAKEQLIFFNADSVQNQILKMRFEMDGYKPQYRDAKDSQIYTTLQFVKTGKYGCFLYSSRPIKFSLISNITGIPSQSTCPHKNRHGMEKKANTSAAIC